MQKLINFIPVETKCENNVQRMIGHTGITFTNYRYKERPDNLRFKVIFIYFILNILYQMYQTTDINSTCLNQKI